MKKNSSSILLIFVFFIGLSVMLYPSVSNYVNSISQSKAVANYNNISNSLTTEDKTDYIEQAKRYNQTLYSTPGSFKTPSLVKGYEDQLNITTSGIMGYIQIEKIKVELPIYHGTDEAVLQVGAGHLEGTSLPVGGENTHSVISAHRGLPSSNLFTDLDQMEVGDIFTINILDEILTYEVDQILIVKPQEVEPLQIVDGEDYFTLLTCTPYAINTHRLLVRGKRIDNIEEKKHLFISADAFLVDPLLVVPVVAAPILLLLLVGLLIKYRK